MKTFEEWVSAHCEMFGLTSDAETAMLMSWKHPFAAAGFEISDLAEASQWMAGRQAPQFRSDHLRLIQQRIFSQRRKHAAALEEESRGFDGNPCSECGKTLWMIVPHLKNVRLGVWEFPWYTQGVACEDCFAGRNMLAKSKAKAEETKHDQRSFRATIGIRHYEQLNPEWRAQMAAVRPGWFDGVCREPGARELFICALREAERMDRRRGELPAVRVPQLRDVVQQVIDQTRVPF